MIPGGLIPRLFGLSALVPTAILLTISFFVLFVVSNIDKKGLKAFGYVVATLLWASALLVFSAGIYTLSTGRPLGPGMPGRCMGKGMPMMRGGAMPMMSQGSMPMMSQGAMPMMSQGSMPECKAETKK